MNRSIFRLMLIVALVVQGTARAVHAQNVNHNFEVSKNLDIFNALYRDLDLYYVDTLDAQKNIDNAANYMLEMLDPYTEYFAEQNTSELKQLTTGRYAGIGAMTSFRPELQRSIIAKSLAGQPAAQVGLMAGDIILSIDGKSVDPCTSKEVEEQNRYASEVSNQLRGEAGTTFDLKVRRPSNGKIYTFRITRRNIVQPSVKLATLATDSVGYIRLSQFIEGTANEVRRALVDIKQRGARSLILDLRGNPGGVLEEAVKTVNLFVARGREVVTTRGKVREQNHTYKTQLDAQDMDIPIVVLTDGGSASAAEITSGALQDYDRAVIMGRRTYGKGLVQQSRELPYKAILKLTTGKYYIPSGRCVQAYKFKDGLPVHLPDSLSREFRTANGRIVRDGGGITPDVLVQTDSLPHLMTYLKNSNQLFDYCVRYRSEHSSIVSPRDFHFTDEEYAAFCDFMKKHKFAYDSYTLRALSKLREWARFEGYDEASIQEMDILEKKLQSSDDQLFERWRPAIQRIVEGAIVELYYNDAGHEEYNLRDDQDVRRAAEMLHNPKQMHKILSGEPDA